MWIRDCLIVGSCPSSLTHCVVGLITGCRDDIKISVVGIHVDIGWTYYAMIPLTYTSS